MPKTNIDYRFNTALGQVIYLEGKRYTVREANLYLRKTLDLTLLEAKQYIDTLPCLEEHPKIYAED